MKENTYTYGNATIVTYRPELTEQEQKKRERQIETALQILGKELVERKAKK
jgi:hypothetical protein